MSDSPYSNHVRRLAYASNEDHPQRNHARRFASAPLSNQLHLRSPDAYAAPTRISQAQQDKEAVDRVNSGQRKDKDTAAKTINDEHAKANTIIDQANAGQKWGDDQLKKAEEDAKKEPNERKKNNILLSGAKNQNTAVKNGEWKENNAAATEKKKDAKAIVEFADKSKDAQNKEFNANGDSKSPEQKAKEDARKGFMKFLDVFKDVMSLLASALPGPGQLLAVGIKLGTTVGKTVASVTTKIAKVVKTAKKAADFGQQLKQALDMKPGEQVIQGANGEKMMKVQEELLGELMGLAGKNTAATAKVEDTTREKPKAELPVCKGPRAQGCRQKARRGFVFL